MLSARTVDFNFNEASDDDWVADPPPARLYRAASVGNSWGVTSMGRGFDWEKNSDETELSPSDFGSFLSPSPSLERSISEREVETRAAKIRNRLSQNSAKSVHLEMPIATVTPPSPRPVTSIITDVLSTEPGSLPIDEQRPASPFARPYTPGSIHSGKHPASGARTPASPRPSRRSSQQRISLIAGRVLIAPLDEAPPSPVLLPKNIHRGTDSLSSVDSADLDHAPLTINHTFLGERNISEFFIEKEIGRGAYGLVKLAREMKDDGSLGPPLVIKQVIKSRILADCWKRHPKYGTIPIEIHVMSAISGTSHELPPRRAWDPARLETSRNESEPDSCWVEGKPVKGHPNICPLLDFFEDNHYYYLLLPCTTPEQLPNEPPPPSDLFDLVEAYPNGLPPSSIRSYLGQLADALCFLHDHGIVHRDIKDENVVLGPNGKCVLIDFGSSGIVKKSGWDTFSGTLDYAGPEILRGERYHGKEQDVWAFGVVAYVLLVGECPFTTADDAQAGLGSPFVSAAIALDERCSDDKEKEGEESDGGGALGDAAALVRACLQVEVSARPTFEKILQSRFLSGAGGWV